MKIKDKKLYDPYEKVGDKKATTIRKKLSSNPDPIELLSNEELENMDRDYEPDPRSIGKNGIHE